MSDKHTDILQRIGRHTDGIKAPEGYFEGLTERLQASLPERPELEAAVAAAAAPTPPRGLWATVRPYVYMAAMFAGVWCMLKMFTTVVPAPGALQPMESNPVMAEAFGNEYFMTNYVYDDLSESDLLDELYDSGADLDSIFAQQ